MKLKIALITLSLCSAQVRADWELVGQTDAAKHYVDISSIRKQGSYLVAWSMADYFKIQTLDSGEMYMSTKTLNVFKCLEVQSGSKSAVAYSEKFGSGNVVISYSDEMYEVKFQDIVPDTVYDTIYEKVCAEK